MMSLARRWRTIKRRTGGFDREAVQWLFATCGVIASVLGVAQFVWPDATTMVGVWPIAGMFAVGLLGGLTLRLVKRTVRAVSSSGRWSIEITAGDVLGFRPCVITTDRRRTFSHQRIAATSLLSQYLGSLDRKARESLLTAVSRANSAGLAKPGDVLVVESGAPSESVLLLACGRPTRSGTVTTWSHLSRTYEGLWEAVRSRHLDEITVPVIGAGYSRLNLSHSAVLLALLLSFHATSIERPVCRRLRIVVPASELDQEELVLSRRFLAALHYSVR